MRDKRISDMCCCHADQSVTVSKLQVGLLGDARRLQKQLDRIAGRADTNTPSGLHYILQGECSRSRDCVIVAHSLLRRADDPMRPAEQHLGWQMLCGTRTQCCQCKALSKPPEHSLAQRGLVQDAESRVGMEKGQHRTQDTYCLS